MNYTRLNPGVHGATIYERIDRTEECTAYSSKLLYIISGDVTATVGGKKLGHLGGGSLLYIPPATPYRLKGQYLRMAVISFDLTDEWAGEACPTPKESASFIKDEARIVSDATPFDRVITVEDMRAEEDAIKKICELTVSAEGEYLAAISARLKLVLLKVVETTDENALPERMVEALGEYIRENVGEDISNTELGAIFGYHPFYISNVLKAAKGMTLKQYITKYRLDLAKRMLEAGSGSIAEIAESCGFTDASYFTKTFRQSTGMTPKEYRNKFKEEFI